MESHVVARVAAEHDVPFAAIRVVVDPVERTIPRSALAGTRPDGTIDPLAVVQSLIRYPRDLLGLIRMSLDARAARATLVHGSARSEICERYRRQRVRSVGRRRRHPPRRAQGPRDRALARAGRRCGYVHAQQGAGGVPAGLPRASLARRAAGGGDQFRRRERGDRRARRARRAGDDCRSGATSRAQRRGGAPALDRRDRRPAPAAPTAPARTRPRRS